MVCDWEKFEIRNYCNALRKMPKLDLLDMTASIRNDQREVELICQVILVAVSQNKDVLVLDLRRSGKWKIKRKNAEYLDGATLQLELYITTETFSQDIKTFVRNNAENYIVLERRQQ